jgi:hypothetical protein
MHLKPQQKPINEDKVIHLVAGQLEVFGTVGKPLPTSFAAGVPARTIMEVLGHSAIGVTMNTYAHVLPELRQEAADAIDELFGGMTMAPLAACLAAVTILARWQVVSDLGALGGTRTPNLLIRSLWQQGR